MPKLKLSIPYYSHARGNLTQVRRRRAAAFFVDLIIAYACAAFALMLMMALALLLYFLSYTGVISTPPINLRGFTGMFFGIFDAELAFLLSLAGLIFYYSYQLQQPDQATVGMRLFSIKVQNFNIQRKYKGGPISLGTAASYLIWLWICFGSALAGIITLIPAYACVLFSIHKRFPHDYILKAMVVRSDLPAVYDDNAEAA